MGDSHWHKPETSKAREPPSTGPIAEAFRAVIRSVVVGAVLAIPACLMMPQYAPIGEQIGLWSVYAIVVLAYLHWKKAKEILPNRNPKRPLKIVWVVLMILLLAVFATFLLMLPAAFLLNLPFWNDTDKKCAFALCFFISQSVLYWVWLCEEREEPPGVK
jgi:hypothetical protein